MTDPDAVTRFTSIYDDLYARVYAYAVSRTGRQLAEEVTSETFAVAWRRFADLPDPPLPWLLGVARNVLRESYRAQVRQDSLRAELRAWTSDAELSVGDIGEDVVERSAVLRGLAALSDEDRELLTLIAWHGLSAAQAAKVIGCSKATFRSRTVVGIDNKTIFSPASGEAAWKKMGSPDLSNGKTPPSPIATDYAQPTRYRLGGQHVGLKTLTGLPADATALEATLRKYYATDMHDQSTASGSWQTWVFGEAQDLLAGPITPGAKTALFQVLAKQPGIKLVGKVTDRLGRPGMAVAMPGDGGTFRLIIAPKTAEYLGDEFWGTTTQSTPDRSTSYQSMGWTDRLGGRP
ncbi:MAG: polymerase [Actinomycetia bacterium]|nr:polymerase [Actinomycetes bacterium]